VRCAELPSTRGSVSAWRYAGRDTETPERLREFSRKTHNRSFWVPTGAWGGIIIPHISANSFRFFYLGDRLSLEAEPRRQRVAPRRTLYQTVSDMKVIA